MGGQLGPHNRTCDAATPERLAELGELGELQRAGLLDAGWARAVLIDRDGLLDSTVTARLLPDLAAPKVGRHEARRQRRRDRLASTH